MWKYEKEFREAHPETIGEKDGYFDLDNYKDWLEEQLEKLFTIPVVKKRYLLPCLLFAGIGSFAIGWMLVGILLKIMFY